MTPSSKEPQHTRIMLLSHAKEHSNSCLKFACCVKIAYMDSKSTMTVLALVGPVRRAEVHRINVRKFFFYEV